MKFSVQELATMVNATLVNDGEQVITRYSMDSRDVDAFTVFLAYKGINYDAHQFLDAVIAQGCCTVIVDESTPMTHDEVSYLVVKDTNQAMLDLARRYREMLSIPVIAITGSNGKTTTKDALAMILKTAGRVVYTAENNNNEIGVAKTILRADETTDFLVLEAGIDKLEDMEILSQMIEPTVSVVTSIGLAHIEVFQTIEAIAEHKCHLTRYARADGLFLYQGDHPVLKAAAQAAGYPGESRCFGFESSNDYVIRDFFGDEQQIHFMVNHHSVSSNLLGRFQASNLSAAILVADYLGIDYETYSDVLEHIVLTDLRLQRLKYKEAWVILDAYKSNPESALAALSILDESPSLHKAVVFADMLGLDTYSEAQHRRLLNRILEGHYDQVLLHGEWFEKALKQSGIQSNVRWFDTFEALNKAFQELCQQELTVLVKGSRLFALERLLERNSHV